MCRAIARRSGAVVIRWMIDWRRSTSSRGGGRLLPATDGSPGNAADAGHRSTARIAVARRQCGGHRAAVVAPPSRHEPGLPIALQVLVYPVTDLSSFDTPSYREFADGYFPDRIGDGAGFAVTHPARPEDGRASIRAIPRWRTDLRGIAARPGVLQPNTTRCATKARPTRDGSRRPGAGAVSDIDTGMIHPFLSLWEE